MSKERFRTNSPARISMTVIVLACACDIALPGAQAWEQQQGPIVASDGIAGDRFGCDVSIMGDYAIVGMQAPHEGSAPGKAYILHRDGATWTEQAKLSPSDPVGGALFGYAVSISGDYALVGAQRDDDNGTWSGSGYVFQRTGSDWSQTKLTASDGAAQDVLGYDVATNGDYAVLGAPGKDFGRGAAYVFHRSGSAWNEVFKLTASDGTAGDHFGQSVSISGNRIVVGAPHDDAGSAYVFTGSGSSWTQQARLTASDGVSGDVFGATVSISDDWIVAGAAYHGSPWHSGAAYAFHWDAGASTWVQYPVLPLEALQYDDLFGNCVSVNGEHVIVAAEYMDDLGTNSGAAYLFGWDGETSSWVQEQKILASDGAAGDNFGSALSIWDGYAIVAAQYDDNANGADAGAVYIFTPEPATLGLLAMGGLALLRRRRG